MTEIVEMESLAPSAPVVATTTADEDEDVAVTAADGDGDGASSASWETSPDREAVPTASETQEVKRGLMDWLYGDRMNWFTVVLSTAALVVGTLALVPVFRAETLSIKSLEIAEWTAKVDFLEQCEKMLQSTGLTSPDCEEAMKEPLLPPPQISYHAARAVKRAVEQLKFVGQVATPIRLHEAAKSYYSAIFVTIAGILLGYLLGFRHATRKSGRVQNRTTHVTRLQHISSGLQLSCPDVAVILWLLSLKRDPEHPPLQETTLSLLHKVWLASQSSQRKTSVETRNAVTVARDKLSILREILVTEDTGEKMFHIREEASPSAHCDCLKGLVDKLANIHDKNNKSDEILPGVVGLDGITAMLERISAPVRN